MRSLLPLAFVPLLARAAFLNSPNGAGAGYAPGGKPEHTDAGWTGLPSGAPPNFPTGNFGGPKNSAPGANPAPSPAPAPAPAAGPPAPAPAASSPAPVPGGAEAPLPAAASSVYSAAASAAGIPIAPTVAPSASVPLGAAPSSVVAVSGGPVAHGMPSPSDMIPAAQCSPGGSSKAQWVPFLVAHQNESPALQCPTSNDANIHWFLDTDNIGCCPQNAYLSTAVAGQYACCPCGSSCAGLPPAAFQDWSLNG
jgi:hypothetical protein